MWVGFISATGYALRATRQLVGKSRYDEVAATRNCFLRYNPHSSRARAYWCNEEIKNYYDLSRSSLIWGTQLVNEPSLHSWYETGLELVVWSTYKHVLKISVIISLILFRNFLRHYNIYIKWAQVGITVNSTSNYSLLFESLSVCTYLPRSRGIRNSESYILIQITSGS